MGSAAVASGNIPVVGALSVTSTTVTATALDVFASGAMTGNVIYGHVQAGISGELLSFSEGGNTLMSVRLRRNCVCCLFARESSPTCA